MGTKRVNQYDLEGNLINTYASACEAERQTGVLQSNICKACKGQLKTAGKSKWSYAEDLHSPGSGPDLHSHEDKSKKYGYYVDGKLYDISCEEHLYKMQERRPISLPYFDSIVIKEITTDKECYTCAALANIEWRRGLAGRNAARREEYYRQLAEEEENEVWE